MTSTIQTRPAAGELITAMFDAVDGELSTRSRVIDALLDLRNAAPVDGVMLLRVDEILREVPGLTTVPNTWWLETLAELRDLV